jgi:hypothetical protein
MRPASEKLNMRTRQRRAKPLRGVQEQDGEGKEEDEEESDEKELRS